MKMCIRDSYYTPAIAAECMEKIFLPTIHAMNAEGCPFKGCLYFGLMLTPCLLYTSPRGGGLKPPSLREVARRQA